LKDSAGLPVEAFARMLADAFTAEPQPFYEDWRTQYPSLDKEEHVFAGWEATLIRQVVDLREMDEVGTLKNEYRYFGVPAPRGAYWYNFDPSTFLECGVV